MVKILFFLMSVLLAGCALITPVNTNVNKYLLDQTPASAFKGKTYPFNLVVLTPETSAAYNLTKMAYSSTPHEIDYYSQNEWAEVPSQMINPLIIRTLQNTSLFNAIVSPPYVDANSYFLRTQIFEFVQDFNSRPAMFRIKVRVSLGKSLGNEMIATKEFSVAQPMKEATAYAGVLAANQAMVAILQDIRLFVVKTVN